MNDHLVRRSITGGALGIAVAISAALGLVGCAPSAPSPEPTSPTTTSTPVTTTPTPTPEPTPTPIVIVLPECTEANATAEAESDEFYAAATGGVTAPRGEIGFDDFVTYTGPVAQTTLAGAMQARACTWPVSFHNTVTQYTAELSPDAHETLIAGLRDSVYVESDFEGLPVFSHTTTITSAVMTVNMVTTYVFVGDVWISIIGNGQLDYVPAAIAGVLALNPGL